MKIPVTVIVPCFNNEGYIEECLRSVEWAGEILLVDSFSTDRTLQIATPLVSRVIQREYVNSASQKNWAIPQAAHDWVLIVDTDEQITDDLRREIDEAMSRNSGYTGYRIARENIVFGRLMRHGGYWPDYQIRLFRKDSGRYEGRRVHAHVLLDGPLGTLTSPFVHFPHQSLKSIRRTLLGRYSSWEARQKLDDGVSFRWPQLIVRPAGAFVTRYVFKRGLLDGWQGLLMASVWSAYVFQTYRKLRRLQSQAESR